MRRFLIALLATGSLLAIAVPAAAIQATLNWTDAAEPDPANEETGFRVERRDGVDANPFVSQGTVGANVTTFNQTGLTLATRYCYRVVSFNAFGDAAASNIACGTPDLPLPVSGLTVIFAP